MSEQRIINRIKHFFTSDVRIVYWLLMIVIAVPLIKPLGFPITISSQTKKAYKFIDSLPAGSYIFYGAAIPVVWSEIGGAEVAMMKQCLAKNLKVVAWGSSADAAMVVNMIFSYINLPGKTYGVDYVNIGYIPGLETAVSAVANSFRQTVVCDVFGTPIDQIPMLKGISGAKDFKLVLGFVASDFFMYYLRHWTAAFGVPTIVISSGASASIAQPYVNSGDITALVIGKQGSAEYELFSGFLGESIKTLDALSISLLLVITLVISGNILLLMKRSGLK